MEYFYCTDCHCDSILDTVRKDESMFKSYNVSQKYKACQLFACWYEGYNPSVEPELQEKYNLSPDDHWGLFKKYMDKFDEQVAGKADFVQAKSLDDINNARKEGKSIAILSLEGAKAIDTLEKLHEAYDRGVRVMTLTWNPNNILGCGSDSTNTPSDTGLTDYGKEVVKECARLGIILDLSHASDKTARGILELNDLPVMASHSNYRDICNVNRNLPKDIADEIVRRGGYIGINLFRCFIKEGLEPNDYYMRAIFPHVEYALKNGYAKNIGFGGDIDGIDNYPLDCNMNESIHDSFVELFRQNGYSEDFIKDTMYRNFFDFIERYAKAF